MDTNKSILQQSVMITPCGDRGPTGIHAACSSTACVQRQPALQHDGTQLKHVMMGSHFKK